MWSPLEVIPRRKMTGTAIIPSRFMLLVVGQTVRGFLLEMNPRTSSTPLLLCGFQKYFHAPICYQTVVFSSPVSPTAAAILGIPIVALPLRSEDGNESVPFRQAQPATPIAGGPPTSTTGDATIPAHFLLGALPYCHCCPRRTTLRVY